MNSPAPQLHQSGADAITICPRCDGSGHWWGGIACWLCAGRGRVTDARARTFNRWGIREDRNA